MTYANRSRLRLSSCPNHKQNLKGGEGGWRGGGGARGEWGRKRDTGGAARLKMNAHGNILGDFDGCLAPNNTHPGVFFLFFALFQERAYLYVIAMSPLWTPQSHSWWLETPRQMANCRRADSLPLIDRPLEEKSRYTNSGMSHSSNLE